MSDAGNNERDRPASPRTIGPVKVWHDPQWTCLLVDNGVSKVTISLTRLQTAALRQLLVPPEAVKPWDSHGDGGEHERLYGIAPGHVFTEQDARDLENLLADWDDEIGHSANIFQDGRLAALRDLGGEELVAAAESEDKYLRRKLAKGAIALLNKRLAERRAKDAALQPAVSVTPNAPPASASTSSNESTTGSAPPAAPDSELDEGFREFCNRVYRETKGVSEPLRRAYEFYKANYAGAPPAALEREDELRELRSLVAALSDCLTDEGADWSDVGLDVLRNRVADALPLEQLPDWLRAYRTAAVPGRERKEKDDE